MTRKSPPLKPGKVYQGDCLQLMKKVPDRSVHLAFADPPFNIGYEYDQYDDRQEEQKYLDWCREWIAQVHRILRDDGTFWLAIGDEYAAELKMIAQKQANFHCRSWVIWYYTFGVNCVRGFSRSHTHLFHFVKDPNRFTFNSENPLVRVMSARQLVYADRRSNPKGRLPDNTWFIRPQDVPEGFQPSHDTWYFSRVAGTFKEREGFHGCQMPEQLLGRIIRVSSKPGEVVFDPFGGSGTTLVVAKKLGRQWIGTELSKDYANKIEERLTKTFVGDSLDGSADPNQSAPKTSDGKKRGRMRNGKMLPPADEETLRGILNAFQATCGEHSTDHLLCNAELNKEFITACKDQGLSGNAFAYNRLLLRLRKAGRLPRVSRPTKRLTFAEMDGYSFASEIAMRVMELEYNFTLDDVLCWPEIAQEFDRVAQQFAPDISTFDLRWAALAIRKRASKSKGLAGKQFKSWRNKELPPRIPLENFSSKEYEYPGVYIVNGNDQDLYVGETLNVGSRVDGIIESVLAHGSWNDLNPSSLRIIPKEVNMHGLQAVLVLRNKPLLNTKLLIC